ncbi:MAG: hypothetical protein M0D55_13270 [Elusimicrobiota bacterium]|nr:MAG: hypothetical protein M0D55_13270 [Elusimicrobiota bacterium]
MEELPITIGASLSRTGGVYYYSASAPGKLSVRPGDKVKIDQTRKLTLPQAVLDSMKVSHGYEQKSVAEITAVQGDRVMIDKGTLHEVHERDVYRIFDATGNLKGAIEVRGIGDLQSSAIFQNLAGVRAAVGLSPEPGDYAVLQGQRKFFGVGIIGGMRLQRTQILHKLDSSGGGGLLWSLTFYNGWGLETLFGAYHRGGSDITGENLSDLADSRRDFSKRSALYAVPIWGKKNFFFHSAVSPFVAAGAYWFQGENSYEVKISNNFISTGIETKTVRGFYPVLGAGVEFFPTRFIRPRVEVRRFIAPKLTARGNEFNASSTIYSIGLLTSW